MTSATTFPGLYQLLNHGFTIHPESKAATKSFSIKNSGKPMNSILPHTIKRNLVRRKPLWPHLRSFSRITVPGSCRKDEYFLIPCSSSWEEIV